MIIDTAEFVASYPDLAGCPSDSKPEFAFIGRSNVGKSSLINMLTQRKGLAKVSATPGKTQLLNFFNINRTWYLVDLPGYGYAKVSKKQHKNLGSMINSYLLQREALVTAFVLIDSTLDKPSRVDLDFLNALGEAGVPFALVFTKSDRVGGTTLQRNISAFLDKLAESWAELPRYFISSSERTRGREEILDYIQHCLKLV
jgi:GTP-binding protein